MGGLLGFVYGLAAMQAEGDTQGLLQPAVGRRVGGQITGGGQDQPALFLLC